MSCRRKDTTALVGCRIGDIALRGCGRGCCPYPDDEISKNTREHLLTCYYPPEHFTSVSMVKNAQPLGRKGLYYNHCQSVHRPKFLCAKSACRRIFKPFYDPERHEYEIDENQGWRIRPLRETNAEFAAAVQREKQLVNYRPANHGTGRFVAELREVSALRRRWENSEPLTKEEMDELKKWVPEMWWTRITEGRPPIRRLGGEAATIRQDRKRCPSCGSAAVRVGSNFRAPKRRNDKAWRGIVEIIEAGEDLAAKFSMCWTVETHAKMVEKAIEMRPVKSD